MPTYSILDRDTGDEFEIIMKYSELVEYLEQNPQKQQIFTKFPGIVDSVRLGIKRPDDNFRDVLKKAKKAHLHSTVNDF